MIVVVLCVVGLGWPLSALLWLSRAFFRYRRLLRDHGLYKPMTTTAFMNELPGNPISDVIRRGTLADAEVESGSLGPEVQLALRSYRLRYRAFAASIIGSPILALAVYPTVHSISQAARREEDLVATTVLIVILWIATWSLFALDFNSMRRDARPEVSLAVLRVAAMFLGFATVVVLWQWR